MQKISPVRQNIWKSCLRAKLLWNESLLSSKNLLKKLPTLSNILPKVSRKKLGQYGSAEKNFSTGWLIPIVDWIKRLFSRIKVDAIRKKNKFKNGTFVRPTCIMVKAVLNLFIISKESYLIPWYILTVWLFQKSIAAMYLFTKSFRAYNCRKTMCFKKKRERALVKCKSFLHNNFFECKVPRELEKQLLSRPISTRNSVFFFRTWVNCMLTFERETFTIDTDLFKKDHLFTTNSFFPFLKPSRDSENQGSFEK